MSRPRLSEAPYLAALLVALFLIFLATWAITVLPPITPPGDAGLCRKDCPMINSPALSKINWTSVLAALASIGVIFGIDFPVEQQLAIVAGIQATQSVLTVVFRTFMTEK